MPLTVPVLDDRRFGDLLEEARSLIPTHAPEWTDHNPTDPGITLLELFAHITEMLIYRLDRVTVANVAAFLNLLDGGDRSAATLRDEDVAAEIRAVVRELRRLDRAVSPGDFERLALEADPRVERARCVPRRNLLVDLVRERPGHVSVIVLPTAAAESQAAEVAEAVQAYLEPRALLTTRVHALGPLQLDVGVKARVVPVADQTPEQVKQAVVEAVRGFLDRHTGGGDGKGWPFGRNVFSSELFALLDRRPEVDFVKSVELLPQPPERLIPGDPGRPIGVEVKPHELVRALVSITDVTVEPS